MAKGIFVFLRRELLWGMHPSVDRMYSSGQLDRSELVREVYSSTSQTARDITPRGSSKGGGGA